MNASILIRCTKAGLLALAFALPAAHAATPAELLAGYTAQAGSPAEAARGEKFFSTDFKQILGFSCSSCHGAVPTSRGKDQVTNKSISALAPAANHLRFTDRDKVEFHFKLNCKDVVGRICTAAEKADVLAWLITLKP